MKTMAIRLEDETSAQLHVIAQLESSSVAEQIRAAIEMLLEAKRSSPELAKHAERITSEIEAETAARKAAITSLFGATSLDATTAKQPTGKASKTA